MSGRVAFQGPVVQEKRKVNVIGSLEERKEAFKEDQELMKETNEFVAEVIKTATSEATKRKLQGEVMMKNKLTHCRLSSLVAPSTSLRIFFQYLRKIMF